MICFQTSALSPLPGSPLMKTAPNKTICRCCLQQSYCSQSQIHPIATVVIKGQVRGLLLQLLAESSWKPGQNHLVLTTHPPCPKALLLKVCFHNWENLEARQCKDGYFLDTFTNLKIWSLLNIQCNNCNAFTLAASVSKGARQTQQQSKDKWLNEPNFLMQIK